MVAKGTYIFPEVVFLPLTVGDEELFVRLYTDSTSMRFIAPPLSPSEAEQRFRHAVHQWHVGDPRIRYWRIEYGSATEAAGLIALVFDEGNTKRAELGIMLQPSLTSKGIGALAMGLFARKVLEDGEVDEVVVKHLDSHVTMERLMRRSAFTEAGACKRDRNVFLTWRLRRAELRLRP